jgi:hypothetical protein
MQKRILIKNKEIRSFFYSYSAHHCLSFSLRIVAPDFFSVQFVEKRRIPSAKQLHCFWIMLVN